MKYYVGVEAEGKFKGALTLFIASDEAPLHKVRSFLNMHREIKNVYFGAQKTYGVPEKYIKLLDDDHWTFIVEVNDISQVLPIKEYAARKNVHIVCVLNDDRLALYTCAASLMFKLENKTALLVYDTIEPDYTSLSDIRYTMDKEVFFE